MSQKSRKKILLLGGAYFQIPAIKYAKKAGYFVITCDYLPDNPGHKFSDEYYNISTIEKEKVLSLAKKLNVDAIVPYGTEPGAPTAAYVSRKLGLPGNSYEGIITLMEKDKFRKFLGNNKLNTPKAKGYDNIEEVLSDIENFNFPLMVKPIDSAASKGVRLVEDDENLISAFKYAMSFSKKKRIIIEEFIAKKGPQLHGDAFVVDGKIVFCYLGDHHFDNEINSFVPCATTLPSVHSQVVLKKVENIVQEIISKLDFKFGAINVEARIDKHGQVFILEIGPRNGGHLVPHFERYASGFDMIKYTVEVALGHQISIKEINKEGFFALYALHTKNEGLFSRVKYHKQISQYILEKHIIKTEGDEIKTFNGVNNSIGFLIFQFPTVKKMETIINNMKEYIEIELN